MELEEDTRKQVAEFLPKAIRKAFDSYYAYADGDWRLEDKEDGEDKNKDQKKTLPKLFAEHHTACKTALTHIELLLKVGKMADVETRIDHTHLALIRQSAKDELNQFYAEEVPQGDENDP